jgi:putative GTP pyrophosphokinase
VQTDTILHDYDAALADLEALGRALRQRVEEWIAAETTCKVHSVSYRLKARESLRGKLLRPDRNYHALWDVTDLLGLRVIVYFEDDVDPIGRVLEKHLPIQFAHSKDRRNQTDGFGYRSLHYVAKPPAGTVPPTRSLNDLRALPESFRFEIQVRTVLEHAWAEIEHDLGYKAREAMPVASRRRLRRLAGLLELADQEFVAVRKDLEAYSASVAARMETDAVSLDLVSLPVLMGCNEVRALDQAIAEMLGAPLGASLFYPDYLLRMLDASGLRTVSEARQATRKYDVRTLVLPYFKLATKKWRLSPLHADGTLPMGYALFFLAHARVLGEAALDVHRIAHLTAFYQTLDYPDDQAAATELASQLVEAFRG